MMKLRRGGRKPAAARRVFLFLAGVQRCRGCGGAYVMVMEGAEKQAGRLWGNKFGMKEVVKEKCDTL